MRIKLLETHPEIAAEWHPTKNGNLTPKDISAGSNKKIWLQCAKGHDYYISLKNRTRRDYCPKCHALSKLRFRKNNLYTTHPEIAEEWHPTKNGNLTPKDVVFGSTRAIWWQCKKNTKHVWKNTISYRTVTASICPSCSNHVSKIENTIVYEYIKKLIDSNIIPQEKYQGTKYRCDCYSPKYNKYIEQTGSEYCAK